VLSTTRQTETTEAYQRYNDTTEFIRIQQQDKELESMNEMQSSSTTTSTPTSIPLANLLI
jgi:hypothetical protein